MTSIWASFLRPRGQLHATHCDTQGCHHLEPDCSGLCLGQVTLQLREQMGPPNMGAQLKHIQNPLKDTDR